MNYSRSTDFLSTYRYLVLTISDVFTMYRMADESVPVPLRVRRSSWYVKQPRYYRHNDDSWTRRNWRVNQMRVWGKRQHQQQQHRRPTTDYSWN